jgi:Zn finger protein HypA/HybF involved in hydrogenase expression
MEGKAPPRECRQHEQRPEPMHTQILQRPVYSNEQQRATLRCPQCGRTKVTDVAKYQDAPRPPKVKCPCGHRFRVPIATPLSSRYRCPRCEGKGYRIMAQGKKVSVSAEGVFLSHPPKQRAVHCVSWPRGMLSRSHTWMVSRGLPDDPGIPRRHDLEGYRLVCEAGRSRGSVAAYLARKGHLRLR